MSLKRVAACCCLSLLAACGSTAQVQRVVVSGIDQPGGPGAGASAPSSALADGPGFTGSEGVPPTSALGAAPDPRQSKASTNSGGGGPSDRSSALPTFASKGFGWDAESVYIGFPTEEDVHQYAGSLGISFDPGSVEADVKAFVASLNAKGGLLGRKIVPVFHDNATTDVEANPSAAAQQNCAAFTQDRQVVAVVNAVPLIDTANWHACLQQHHTPLVNASSVLYDDTSFRQYGPYLWATLVPNMSTFAPAWMTHLKRLTYFSSWDTSVGAAGSAPAKVGILMPDDAGSQRLVQAMKRRLQQIGVEVGSEYAYHDSVGSYGGDMSAAILRFRAANVTHVLSIPPIALALIAFMQAAEQQGYRPRYAMNSVINPFAITGNAPKAQLQGSMGIGWMPGADVDTAHDPGVTSAQRDCLAALRSSGQSFSGDGRRSAQLIAFSLCTSLNLLVKAAMSAGGLTPQHFARGLAAVGPGFPTAPTFHSGLSATDPTVPDVIRDLFYVSACNCFTYRGGLQPL